MPANPEKPLQATEASLYIHVPFCNALCDYCDFFSVPANAALMDAFVGVLLDDVRDQLSVFGTQSIPSVYIGGGTPSALGAGRMEKLLAGLNSLLAKLKHRPVEFTVEANPESADGDFLKTCRDGGVNRISLGIQTFNIRSREEIGRQGRLSLLSDRLSLAARHFPAAFCADLMAGLPFQTMDVLAQDIKRLLEAAPAHVSLYSLILEPETPLGKRVCAPAESSLPPGWPCRDEGDDLWIAGRDMLESAGFGQYEVSNFARPGAQCVHNMRYWRMENWLGAGPAASGTVIDETGGTGRRLTYGQDVAAYLAVKRPLINNAAVVRIEELSQKDLMAESLLMGFRCKAGPDPQKFKSRFGTDIKDCIPDTVMRWQKRGFFEETSGKNLPSENTSCENLRPSKNGLLFLNTFLRDAFVEWATGFADAKPVALGE